jgi:methoxymalonate biosynthesis acyl carrier protein
MAEDIRAAIREYLTRADSVLRPGAVSDSTPLAHYGVLDSIAALELVSFLEMRFAVEFTTRDLDRRRLETIEQLEALVSEKIAERAAREAATE